MVTQTLTKKVVNGPPQTSHRLIAGDELFALDGMERAELVKGKIIHQMPTSHLHGHYEMNFGFALKSFVRQHKLGRVLTGEAGVYTARNPDSVRGIGVGFISHERLARVESQSYLDVPPELIVEIMSPGDSWSGVTEKLEEYFHIGVDVVWVADPRRRSVYIYHSLTDIRRLTEDDHLVGSGILADFRVPVKELFEDE